MTKLKYEYHINGKEPPVEIQNDNLPVWIFVYGSNLAGRHGAGAALCALRNYGARLGVGIGREGRSYGIPTKDEQLISLLIKSPKDHMTPSIAGYVNLFKAYAKHRGENAHEKFWVTGIGTQLAGYTHAQIAPLFRDSPSNCSFPIEWREYLEDPATLVSLEIDDMLFTADPWQLTISLDI